MCFLCLDPQYTSEHLEIDGCPRLIQITSDNIQELFLSHLPHLTRINPTHNTQLTVLEVTDCPFLETIRGCFGRLRRLTIRNCPLLKLELDAPRLCTLVAEGDFHDAFRYYPSLTNLSLTGFTSQLLLGGWVHLPSLSNITLNMCGSIHLYELSLSSLICIDTELARWSALATIMKPTACVYVKGSASLTSLADLNVTTIYLDDCPNLTQLPRREDHAEFALLDLRVKGCPNISTTPPNLLVTQIDGKLR